MNKREHLASRIWKTERSRILAEQRMLHYEMLAHFATIWYSFLLVVWSLFQAQLHGSFRYSDQVNIALSVLVLVVSTVLYGLKFGEKASEYKACYHELQQLRSDLDAAKDVGIPDIESKYVEILRSSANHNDWDYQRLVVKMWLEGRAGEWDVKPPTAYKVFGYVVRWFLGKVIVFTIFAGPIVLAVLLFGRG